MADSLNSLHPALASFYNSLGDEQKAKLVAMTLLGRAAVCFAAKTDAKAACHR
jgi:hypothetical protein